MSDERGFTLLEVLVASVIAAVVFGVLMLTALNALGTVRNAGAYETALSLARSHLAMLGRNMAEVPANSHGSDGPFYWQLQVSPEAVANPGPGIVNWFEHKDQLRATLYAVSIIVVWQADGHRRQLHVETQRLGFALPPPVQP
jgi:general secretion pathway protein I